MRVAQVSESVFTVQGHGVHTAFVETTRALKQHHPSVAVQINTREPADVRHIHTVGFYALSQLLLGTGKKVVSAHIVPESLVGSLRGAVWWKGFAAWYLKVFYNHADIVIAVSDETKRALEKMGVKKPIKVIHNMVDIGRYAPKPDAKRQARERLGYALSDHIVVSNGQVQPRKRVDIFLQVAKKLPDIKFIWVGGIPFKNAAAHYQEMKRLVASAPKNVQFTDTVPLEEVREYFHAADVFVMPSDQETFGLAIVEAAASGLPLVLRDLHDYDETFRDDAMMCGEDEFADCIETVLKDKALYDELLEKSARLARKYDSQRISGELVALYRSLL